MHDCGHDGCDGPYTDHHTFTDGKRHCSCICDGCGNPEVQLCYENYRGDLLCCECAGCFDRAPVHEAPHFVDGDCQCRCDICTPDGGGCICPDCLSCRGPDDAVTDEHRGDHVTWKLTGAEGAFWADLEGDMKHPEFRKFYEQAMRKMNKERNAPRILATGKRLWRRINQWPFRYR